MAIARRIIDSFSGKELELYDLLIELKNSDPGTRLTCEQLAVYKATEDLIKEVDYMQYIKYNEQEDQFELDDDTKIGDDELDVIEYFRTEANCCWFDAADWYLTDEED
ncbi:MAG: hypothetical protein MJ245_07440 [Clostridia bacterium]|nr:hypothetical protein [Clostridia bacterium]